jgi:hypothetical protein
MNNENRLMESVSSNQKAYSGAPIPNSGSGFDLTPPQQTRHNHQQQHRQQINNSYINWSAGLMSNNEHQTYAGYLKKQGALFKQWKERYFVLDSVKHQVDNSRK